LRHEDSGERFPWFGHRSNFYRQEFVVGRVSLRTNQNDLATARIAILRELNSKPRRVTNRKDYGDVRFVDIKNRPVTETRARVRRSAFSCHFPYAKRAHDRCAVARAASDQLYVRRIPAKILEFIAK